MNQEFLRDLSDRIEAMRPPERRAGGAIDLQQQHGLLFVDYSRLPSLRDPTRLIVAPVLAIEIKVRAPLASELGIGKEDWR